MESYSETQCLIKIEEGKQYQEDGDYDQALTQYYYAFNMFIVPPATYEYSEGSIREEMYLVFLLFDLLYQITFCYAKLKEPPKYFIFLENSTEIIAILDKYQDKFNVEELNAYRNMSNVVSKEFSGETASLVAKIRAESETRAQFIDNSNDMVFKELCSKFDKCYSYRISLLPSRRVSIIETKEQRPVQISHVVAAIFFPPLGVYLTVGLGTQFWINLVLTFAFTWIPGVIHALWLVYNHD